ncbi:hypothetical protein SEVIR_4G079400v4 [Setaria viridis]|uniref:Cyclin-dependent kinase inhibitor domain-containing protein n=1 Tax=Setaria viridis TaxID=4556 RepID=A0A4U6UXN3_SETVI|nr:cyclin-dependent kinase inhibitor 1-like [Setaria viridis]TKW20325.1 hypothetical protein SEVIR_4G079400v2 [Setaria viridis]
MGKYMRKRTGRAPAGELAQVVVGVRTRSRSAAFASAAAAPAPKRPRKQAAARAEVEVGAVTGRGDGGCAAAAGCYLQLRSRRLFMAAAAAEVRCSVPAEEKAALPGTTQSGATGEPVVVVTGMSRCSSTASSVDVVVAAARERSDGAAEVQAREDPDVESSVSDSAGCGRERREATPSSRPPVDLSDEESSQAADDQKHHRRMSLNAATAAVACRARMPAEEEMEDFFASAEKAEAERFAAKYNFDVARGLPLDSGGRFEWTTVAASG